MQLLCYWMVFCSVAVRALLLLLFALVALVSVCLFIYCCFLVYLLVLSSFLFIHLFARLFWAVLTQVLVLCC